ncbi:MAG: serine hydrolase family protein [Bdellovibrionales bacterium]|nr:serine hydrolase family protein [Bdellovibrionales bacterium]
MNAVIIHGTLGTPRGNWFPWLTGELTARGVTVVCPAFPTPENQSLEQWFSTFETSVGLAQLTEDSLLIGHSCGATFALRLVERLSSRIRGLFLVAGVIEPLGIPEYDSLNASFIARPFEWDKIRSNCRHIQVYHSPNDPYVPLDQGQRIAEALGAPLREIAGGGHLNAEFGYTSFRQLSIDVGALIGD